VAKAILVQVLLGTGIGIVLSMLVLQLIGGDLRQSLMLGPLFFLAAAALAILGWALFLTLFRRRMSAAAPGGRVGWSFVAAVFAGILNLVVASIVGILIGQGDPFIVVYVLVATAAFGLGALVANLLTNLVIVRPERTPA
jgi:hypothetical protein